MTMSAQAVVPVFPPEIWLMVFSHLHKHRDLLHLWTRCRLVSKMFRNEIEQICISKHLPKTEVVFHLGWFLKFFKVDLRNISFTFDRVTEDSTMAVFKMCEVAEDFMPEVIDRMSRCIPTTANPLIRCSNYHVSIHGEENDTELPGFMFDHHVKEISFDWRKAYSFFFAEEI